MIDTASDPECKVPDFPRILGAWSSRADHAGLIESHISSKKKNQCNFPNAWIVCRKNTERLQQSVIYVLHS